MLLNTYSPSKQDFIPHVAALLQMLLGKCRISVNALSRILAVTATLYRKAEQSSGNAVPNLVASAFLESVLEMLITKSKAISSSLSAAMEVHIDLTVHETCLTLRLQVIMPHVGIPCIPPDRLPRLAEYGLMYLHSYSILSPWHQDFFNCQAVAKMVLQAATEYNLDLLQNLEVGTYFRYRLLLTTTTEQSTGRSNVEHGPPGCPLDGQFSRHCITNAIFSRLCGSLLCRFGPSAEQHV